MKRAILLFMLATIFSGFLTACHTIEGAGKDIKEAGETVEETAEDARNN